MIANTCAAGAATTLTYTDIINVYVLIRNLGNPKKQTAFVRALQPDPGWERFDIGIPTPTILMDMLGDRSYLFRCDPILRLSTKSTGNIAAKSKTITCGTRVFDAGITKQVHLLVNYTVVSIKKY